MTNRISRRDWLKLIGGSAVGMMLTPIPWKILDDSAKWTQNWSWTPVPSNGKISYKHTTCTLCPAACGVRARRVDNRIVSLAGTAGHPVSGGSLCAMGLAGHLLRYHPAKVLHPYKRGVKDGDIRMIPVSHEKVLAEIVEAISSTHDGSVAILDSQPKRTVSYAYRRFLAGLKNGVYINPPASDAIPTNLTGSVLSSGDIAFGFDIERCKTLLSFGTPLLDGWGTQGQFSAITGARREFGSGRFRIIQVEPASSRTARLADEWIPVRPGSEAVFALGLAQVIIREKLCDMSGLRSRSTDFDNASGHSFVDLASKFSPAYASTMTGIPAEKIAQTARRIATRKPAAFIFGGNPGAGPFGFEEQLIFMDLNILVGAVGAEGGLAAQREIPGPFARDVRLVDATYLADVPDHSVRVLIIDGGACGDALPWSLIEEKLTRKNHLVVNLASHFAGTVSRADYILPSPGYMETAGDMPTPRSASTASYSISAPLSPAPKESVHPLDFLKRIAERIGMHPDSVMGHLTIGTLLRKRLDNIHSIERGKVFDAVSGKAARLSGVSSSEFRRIIEGGGCWVDESPARFSPVRYSFLGGNDSNFGRIEAAAERSGKPEALVLVPVGIRGVGTIAQSSPMMTKLYRESDLRSPGGSVSVNPSTGKQRGLNDGAKATIRTESGAVDAMVHFDASVMPGVLQANVGPGPSSFYRVEARYENNILDICRIESDSTWRTTKAEIAALETLNSKSEILNNFKTHISEMRKGSNGVRSIFRSFGFV